MLNEILLIYKTPRHFPHSLYICFKFLLSLIWSLLQFMWGSNSFGQCGVPLDTKCVTTPTAVAEPEKPAFTKVSHVACGEKNTVFCVGK